ncbi:hypothetical protein [Comamonas sp.]|uniref:hypothetical protein n=1 Tax=Comamonas sp. TaxID=34028 RepID=UPI00289E5C2F|nr:hypothetical protein [Comamonas sp.]
MNERVSQITGGKSKEMGWLRWLGLTALVLVSGLFILAKLLPDDPSADQRAAIDLCWKDHQNPALDDATKRFVASTCQSMEADYLKKHGRNP